MRKLSFKIVYPILIIVALSCAFKDAQIIKYQCYYGSIRVCNFLLAFHDGPYLFFVGLPFLGVYLLLCQQGLIE
jgi:hypothetical protein